MIAGARRGSPNVLRRLASRMAGDLTTYVVPGLDVARAQGLDLQAAGLCPVLTPRHAAVLLLVGPIPPGLGHAAATVYAQMPRPRLIVAASGPAQVRPLPPADLRVDLHQGAIMGAVAQLRQLLSRGWKTQTQPFTGPVAEGELSGQGQHQGMHWDHEGDGQGGMQHGGRGQEGVQHDEGGGMSMVMMTMHLPRSADGLPMEWLELPFGPIFPGLPGGLGLTLTLDGDSVAGATHEPGIASRGLGARWPSDVAGFIEGFAELDPLAPVSYRVLAERALEQLAGTEPSEAMQRQRVGAVERERAASHLNWLVSFGLLLGDERLSSDAARLQHAVLTAGDVAALRQLQPQLKRFSERVLKTPLLQRRLGSLARLEQRFAPQLRGPVARAAGLLIDARADDHAYRALSFSPVLRREGDVFARLRLRLAEIEQGLQLAIRAGPIDADEAKVSSGREGTGVASIETPRGTATLTVTITEGAVASAQLDAPSTAHAGLIKPVAEGCELSDALLGIASLDLSPWEIDQ